MQSLQFVSQQACKRGRGYWNRYRIDQDFLIRAGFGGSCFKRYFKFSFLSRHFGLNEVADFWEVVVDLNNWHQHRISRIVVKNLWK